MNLFSSPLLMLTNSAEWIAIASLKTIPLIVLILILQRVFRKKLSATSRYLLWLSVLLSLSIPFGWTLDFTTLSNNASIKPAVTLEQGTANSIIQNSFPINKQKVTASDNLITHNALETQINNALDDNIWANISKYFPIGLAVFWLCGVLVFFRFTFIQAQYFQRIKAAAMVASDKNIAIFNSCKQELGINKSILLLSTNEIQSPITLGWLRPAVLIPKNIEQQITAATLKHVLLHELGHIKRQDIFFNWLACLINILHWFNPMVWLACKRMRMDMEIACDALVLSHLDESQRKTYGVTLIEIGEIPRISPRAKTTLGILENHKELKERLTMIKEFTTMNIKNTLIFGLVLASTTFTALAQPAMQKSQPAVAEAATIKAATTSGTNLREVAARAERDLKTKVLVGQKDADTNIQVNFGTDKIDYGQLLTQLKMNEYTAYKSKDYIQIINIREARNLSIPTVEKDKTYYEDEVVTDYLKTEKACSAQVLATIRPLIPQYGHLSVYEDARTLIIIDTYGNIQRIKSVLKALEANLDAPVDCKSVKPPEFRPNKS